MRIELLLRARDFLPLMAMFLDCTVWAAVIETDSSQSNTAYSIPSPNLLSGAMLNANPNAGWDVLTDGQFGDPSSSWNAGGIGNGYMLTYTLDTSTPLNSAGYDLSAIDTYSAWGDSGRFWQDYTVRYQTVGSPAWTDLTTVAYHPGSGNDAHVNLAISAVTGVQAVQFYFNNVQNGYVGYRELVVQGTPAPACTWKSSSGGDWNTVVNWTNSAVPNLAGVGVLFGSTLTNNANPVNISNDVTVGALQFSNNLKYTLSASPGQSLTLQADSGATILDQLGSHEISAPLILGSDTTVSVTNMTDMLTISGNVSGMGSLTHAGPGKLTLSGSNTQAGGTIISGGMLQVGAARALSTNGPLIIGGGTLDLGGFTKTTSAAVSFQSGVAKNGTIVNNGSAYDAQSGTVSASLQGSGGLNKTTSGILTLNNGNTYTGATNLGAGVLSLGAAEIAGTSGPLGRSVATNPGSIMLNGGTLQYSASNQNDYSGRFSNAANQAYNVDTNGQNVIWSTALISSGGNLAKTGDGTLTLSAANTYNGPTTISGGILNLANPLAVQTSTVTPSSSGTLTFATGNTSPVFGGLAGTGNIVLATAAAQPVALRVGSNNQDTIYSGILSGGTGLTKQGSGTLTLTASQNYGGPTVIKGGVLKLVSNSLLNVQFGRIDGQHGWPGSQQYIGQGLVTSPGNNTWNLLLSTNNSSSLVYANGTTATGISVNVLNAGVGADNLGRIIGESSNSLSYGQLCGGGTGMVTISGLLPNTAYRLAVMALRPDVGPLSIGRVTAGSTTLASGPLTTANGGNDLDAQNWASFNSVTTDNSGVLTYSITDSGTDPWRQWYLEAFQIQGTQLGNLLPVTTPLTIAANSTLDLGGGSQQVASLSDYSAGIGGSIINSSLGSASVLTLSPTSGTTTFSGMIQGGGTLGTISLIMSGSGTQVLSGSNSYTGSTTINGGTLQIGAGGSITFSSITVEASGTLDVSTLNATPLAIAANRSLTNNHVVLGNLTAPAGTTLSGTGSYLQGGTGPFSVMVAGGAIQPGNGGGTLTVGANSNPVNLDLQSNSTYQWGATSGVAGGLVQVFGNLSIGTNVQVAPRDLGYAFTASDSYTIMTWTGTDPVNDLVAGAAQPAASTGTWTGAVNTTWDRPGNWSGIPLVTGGSISKVGKSFVLSNIALVSSAPGENTDVVIAPSGGVAVTGPAAFATVKSLSLGNGIDPTSLAVQAGGRLTVTNTATLNNNTTLSGSGTLLAASLSAPSGMVKFDGVTLQVPADTTNIISGSGNLALGTGGLGINTNGHIVTLNQTLTHDAGIGAVRDGGLTKAGDGMLTLTASQNYTGPTVIKGGVLKLNSIPAVPGTPELWLDAATASTFSITGSVVDRWTSRSGFIFATGQGEPMLLTNALNGLPVVDFGTWGSGKWMQLSSELTDIRTVFWVLGSQNGGGFLLGDTSSYDFHRGGHPFDPASPSTPLWDNEYTSNSILSGITYVNGVAVNGTTTGLSGGYQMIDVTTAGPLRADALAKDRNESGRQGGQQLGELIVYNTVLSESERLQVEAYLNAKWFGVNAKLNYGINSSAINTLPITTTLTIAANSTLDLNGDSQQVASLGDFGPGLGGSIVNSWTGATSLLTLATSGSSTFSGMIEGSGTLGTISLVMSGTGTQVLAGANTYTGGTIVNSGKLSVNGSLASHVTVNDSGTLSGTGYLSSVTVNDGGHLGPGNSPGTLHLSGSLTLAASAVMDFELDTLSTSDEISMPSGYLSLNGQQFTDFLFTPLAGFGPGNYTLIDAGLINGSLGTNLIGVVGGRSASLFISGNDLMLNVAPEPSSLALLGVSAIGILGYGWRRRQKRSISPAEEPVSSDDQDDSPDILSMPSRWTPSARRAA